MDLTANDIAHIAWVQAWQLTVLIAAVALITRVVCRNQPHLAHALWLVVLVKCVTPPIWSSSWGIFCLTQPARTNTDEQAESRATTNREAPVDVKVVPWSPRADEHLIAEKPPTHNAASTWLPVSETTDDDTVAAKPTEAPGTDNEAGAFAGPEPGDTSGELPLWFLIWMCGFGLIVCSAVIRLALCLRAAKRAGWRRDPDLEALAVELARTLKLKRSVRVVVTNSRLGPAVVGLFRPLILLPDVVVRGRTPADLSPILMHELVHIRRGDLWVGLLQVVASALWWFHPLVWICGRLMSREAERCCDEESIAALGGDTSRYAYSLLDVLDLKQSLKPVPSFPGVRPVEVTSKRLERIMSLRQGCRKRTPWWCRLCTAALAIAVLPGAALIVSANGEPARDVARDTNQPDADEIPETRVGHSSPMTVKTYAVSDLLRKLMLQQGVNEAIARQIVKQSVVSSCDGLWDETPGVDRSQSDVASARWFLTDLVVRQTRSRHLSIQRMLEVMRKFGFEEASFKIRVIMNPPVDLRTRWTLSRTDTLGEDEAVERLGQPHLPSSLRPLDRPLPGKTETPRSRARMSVETNLIPLQEIMDKARAVEVIQSIQRHAKSTVMSAPAVTIFNGRTAAIQHAVQRPFVVGISDGKPQIHVVSEGLGMRLRPVSREDGSIWLDYEVALSEVRDVKTTTIRVDNRDKPITLQNPTIARIRLDSSVAIPPGKTLLIGGLKHTNRKGKTDTIWLMIEPSKFKLRLPNSATRPKNAVAGQTAKHKLHELRDAAKPAKSAAAKDKLNRSKLQPFVPKTNAHSKAVGRILALGGEVVSGEHKGERFVVVHLKGKRCRDADLDVVHKLPGPVSLLLTGTSVTDAGLARCVATLRLGWLIVRKHAPDNESLSGLRHIFDKQICLIDGTGSRTTIAALQNLSRTSETKTLLFQNVDAGGTVLTQVASLKGLERFGIDVTHAKASRLKDLARLSKLRELYLSGPNLTDGTLLQLVALKQLRKLSLSHGRVSEDAVDSLRELLPNCQIVVNQPRAASARKSPAYAPDAETKRSQYWAAPPVKRKPATWKDLSASRRKSEVRQAAAAKETDRKTLIVKTYPVADLVVPIPGTARLSPAVFKRDSLRAADHSKSRKRPAVDMQPLVKLIQTRIAPTSWGPIEGQGTIRSFETTLSIVVRQTADVHEQIVELLSRLRRHQDVQVTLSVKTIEVPRADLLCQRIEQRLNAAGFRQNAALLSSADAKSLTTSTAKSKQVKTLQQIKITLFRNQAAEIPSGLKTKGERGKSGSKLQIAPRVSDDRRTVRVQVALDAANALDALAKGIAAGVPDGRTILIDVDDLTASRAIPFQSFTRGDVERVVGGKRNGSANKTFLLVTPRVIVQEEEEELLLTPPPSERRR